MTHNKFLPPKKDVYKIIYAFKRNKRFNDQKIILVCIMVFSFFSHLGKGKRTPSVLPCEELYFEIYHEKLENSLIDKDLVILFNPYGNQYLWKQLNIWPNTASYEHNYRQSLRRLLHKIKDYFILVAKLF
jgi:hypothetical protein